MAAVRDVLRDFVFDGRRVTVAMANDRCVHSHVEESYSQQSYLVNIF
jgi:hypothetical protein